MPIIHTIAVREILDSRGNPTVEATVMLRNGLTTSASIPSGASTGRHEAWELHDGGKRYAGKGVLKAVHTIEKVIASKLRGVDCRAQKKIDYIMIDADGTKNKRKLGANSILAVSIACARAAALTIKKPLYFYLNYLAGKPKMQMHLPQPFFNLLNGGKHADSKLSFQEFMIVPRMKSFAENLRVGSEIYHQLKQELHQKYGKGSTNVGDEGGFAFEKLDHANEALRLLLKAITNAGYRGKVSLAIDCAASECRKGGRYIIDGKAFTTARLINFYLALIKKYPLISLEDPFHQEDFHSFAELRSKTRIQIVGDDLTVTNTPRISTAIEKKSCTCLLLKPNQIGTLTEALAAAKLARQAGWKLLVSHRSGETEDTFIADLAVGLGAEYCKFGAPCRGERTAKYNQLIRIAEVLRS